MDDRFSLRVNDKKMVDDFATSIDENAVHGSDSAETAKIEIPFFFKPQLILSR